MKKIIEKIANAITIIFGYGIMITLLVGGLTFFGYLAALIIGGNTASDICTLIFDNIYPILVILTTSMILLGLIKMYLVGESAFSGNSKEKRKKSKSK